MKEGSGSSSQIPPFLGWKAGDGLATCQTTPQDGRTQTPVNLYVCSVTSPADKLLQWDPVALHLQGLTVIPAASHLSVNCLKGCWWTKCDLQNYIISEKETCFPTKTRGCTFWAFSLKAQTTCEEEKQQDSHSQSPVSLPTWCKMVGGR